MMSDNFYAPFSNSFTLSISNNLSIGGKKGGTISLVRILFQSIFYFSKNIFYFNKS